MKKIELLAPAGDLERLKIAFTYGADAVYIGGEIFGMRSAAKNFTIEEMKEGVEFAHNLGKQVFVTINIIPRSEELEQLPPYLLQLQEIGVDAVIVSDAGVFSIVKKTIPNMEVHISTQASTSNSVAAKFWYEQGAQRVVTARELSFDEIRSIRDNVPEDMDIEAFVHGAMCMSYSGKCVISNYTTGRDANRGACAQPCRWKYNLVKENENGEYEEVINGIDSSFFFNSKDLCMIEYIPQLIECGITSFKIEGRMKSIHYVSTVTNCYKAAVDAYMESPEAFEAIKEDLIDELWKVAQRELATGFYYHTPTENEQLFGARRKIPQYKFVGEVVSFDNAKMEATIRQRNVIMEGDRVEFYGPGFRHFECFIDGLRDAEGNKIDRAPNPMELLTITLPNPVKKGDMIRACKEGLVNLYQNDGTSKTVRA